MANRTFPLSHPQKRILYTEQRYPHTGFANITYVFWFEEAIDPALLNQVVNLIVARYDSMRLTMVEDAADESLPVRQYTAAAAELYLNRIMMNSLEECRDWAYAQAAIPFALFDGPLYHFAILETREKIGLFVKLHHLISDGYTLKWLSQEIMRVYGMLQDGKEPDGDAFSYAEFLEREQNYKASDEYELDRQYWTNKFATLPEEVNLHFSQRKVDTIKSSRQRCFIDQAVKKAMDKGCRAHRTTIIRLLLAALAAYIYRVTGQQDFVMGVPFHGRQTRREKAAPGMFVSTLPMRFILTEEMNFTALVQAVNREVSESLEHSNYPYDQLAIDLKELHGTVPDLLALNVSDITGHDTAGIQLWEVEPAYDPSPLTVYISSIRDAGDVLWSLITVFQQKLFGGEDVRQMLSRIITLLEDALAHPDKKLYQLRLMPPDEERLVLETFNATTADYRLDTTIHELFEAQAARLPDKPAVVYNGQQLTYRELNEQANRLASLLTAKGVGADSIVGVLLNRSLEMIVAPLAVLKAGGAYLPIDPAYPDDRIAYMLEDSGAAILLSQRPLKDKCACFAGEWLDVEDRSLYTGFGADRPGPATSRNLVYVIYTSGSTGKPKGVLIEHRALINLCAWQNDFHQVTDEDTTALYSGFGFDACVWEIFPFLTAGATIHIIPDDIRLSPLQVNEYFETHHITIADLPTQFCEQFMESTENQSLRRLITGGDKLRNYRPARYTLTNEYGPTEYTISATAFEVDGSCDNIPIGKPLANTEIFILDPHGRPQPVGVPGELCIAGAQLARGYLNRPDLTAEKFVPHPLRPGERMYRTGDSARWLPDGNVEFLGRIDYQVKIRGFRIELGEIEQQIIRHELVKDVTVLDREDQGGNKYLCAYIVTAASLATEELRRFLAASLPDYMIPPYVVELPALPLTANGKVDRRALPEPELTDAAASYAAPRSELEEKLTAIWQDILGVSTVGIDDNFFELGGHSLRAGILQARLLKQCRVRLTLADLFTLPTIRTLAERISSEQGSEAVGLTAVAQRDTYPVSAEQKVMYTLSLAEGVGASYNVAIANRIRGPLDAKMLEQSINKVIARHEALRTRFLIEEEDVVQQIAPSLEIMLAYAEAEPDRVSDSAYLQSLLGQIGMGEAFDLSSLPLIRTGLVKLSQDEHLMFVEVHHIAFDGMSLEYFLRETALAYDDAPLPPPAFQFKDYTAWHNTFLQSAAAQEQETFWLQSLQGELPVLQLATDYVRPARQSFEGDRLCRYADESLANRLKILAESQGASLYMVLLAAYYALLARYTGQDDMIIGTPVAGRSHPDTDGMIGVFINTLPLRAYPAKNKTFLSLLGEVRELVLGAMDRQTYPFYYIIEKLGIGRNVSRNPLFDTMFVLQNTGDAEFRTANLQGEYVPLHGRNAQVDLTVEAEERNQRVEFTFEFGAKLFRRETIERFAGHYLALLQAVCDDPQGEIGRIGLLSSDEQQKLLVDFNNTALACPRNKTVHQLFEEAAAAYPDKTALVYQDISYTYDELNQKANRLAHHLRISGVGPDMIAAVMVERSAHILVAALAVMKAGGAYLPIDPSYPGDRISYLLQDSRAVMLLTQRQLMDKVNDFDGLCLDLADDSLYAGGTGSNPLPVTTARHLAYVIYTSGSTGKPKGVMIEHASLVNLCAWQNSYHDVTSADNAAAYSGFGFDASIWEIFPFITCGAELHILSEDIRLSLGELNRYFETHHITITNLPTQICEQFMELTDNHSLKTLVTGGDKLRNFKPRPYRVVNEYGPTEYTISATAFLVDRHYDNIPVGKPLANTWLYVLDPLEQLQPIGVPGELCIAGAQIARGYLGRPELTAEKFVANPYAVSQDNAIMYKTGDLVRWLPDGNVEFLGRIDQQVKIRGYRIELGEIEQHLLQHPGVKDAVVIDRSDAAGMKYLCAYFVADGLLTADELKSFLAKDLPDYMVPAYFVPLENIPLTPNGKIDKRALPEPAMTRDGRNEYVPPRNETEERLAEAWQAVLGIRQVSIHDNFFHLGGDSIKAIQVISRLGRYQIKLEMKQLFQYPRISELSRQVRRIEKAEDNAPVHGDVPLTPIQTWFFASEFADPHHWNQSTLLYAENGLHPATTSAAFTAVVEHHDALRMVYRRENDGIRQYNRGLGEGELFTLTVKEIDSAVDGYQAAMAEGENLQRSMDLRTGPLVKLALIQQQGSSYLAIVIHHLVVDGVSWKIIFDDFATAYSQAAKGEPLQLPPKTDAYRTWAALLREYARGRKLLRELPYWQAVENQKVGSLPVDYPQAGPGTNRDAATAEGLLTRECTARLLTSCHKAYHTDTEDVFMAGLGLALRQWAGLTSVAVTLEGHGREDLVNDIDISRTVGWFTSTYPVVVNVGRSTDPGYILKTIKENIRRIPNKGAGYDIIRHLTPDTDKETLICRLKPEIEFNYLGQMDEGGEESTLFSVAAVGVGQDSSPDTALDFRLMISAMVLAGQLKIGVTYNRREYDETTMAQFLKVYLGQLQALVEHCVARKEPEATPSDLGDATLTLSELAELRSRYGPALQAVYPLSPMQEGMLFLSLMNETSSAYFEQSVFEVQGRLDMALFERHFNRMIRKHDILRTAFVHEGVVRQVVLANRPVTIHYEDLTALDEVSRQDHIDKYQTEDRSKGFRLADGPLIRLAVFATGRQRYAIVLGFHHIILDGWSMGLLAKELFGDYQHTADVQPSEDSAPVPYRRYIEWLIQQDKEEAQGYWRHYLAGCETRTVLPQGRPDRTDDGYHPQDRHLVLDRTLTARLHELAREQQVTLNSILQAVWGILLQRYNNSDDAVFGAVVSGRIPEVKGIEEMVGLFINTIPVRVQCDYDRPFADLVKQVQLASLSSERYSYLPLADIQSGTTLKDALISHLVAFQNAPVPADSGDDGLQVKETGGFDQINYSFGLVIVPGEEVHIRFSYNGLVFDAAGIDDMAGHLLTVLETVASNPSVMVHSIGLLPDTQRRLLDSFRGPRLDLPAAKTVCQLFEEAAAQYPDKIAVVYKEQTYTYAQLNAEANRLARVLRGQGVMPDSTAAILVERGPGFVLASLAVMKAGGAYVPIGSDYPDERIEYVLQDSGALLLLTETSLLGKGGAYGGVRLNLDDKSLYDERADGANLEPWADGSHLAYVIYTSGSTGRPKGAMIEHHSLVNFCTWYQQYNNLTADDRVAGYSNVGFDGSVMDVFPTLTCGAELHIIPDELRLSPAELSRYFDEQGITITFLTTQFGEQFVTATDSRSLKTLLTGGDKLHSCRLPGFRFANVYGPTEYTVLTTAFVVDKEYDNIPIGKPVANTWLYVLDRHQQLQPVGVPGELCIAGAQLARGYINQDALTAEKFVANPYATYQDNARLYRTGDLARWLPDGNLEFLGRIDQQVKVRGYRIELGEIEEHLKKHPHIQSAVVIDRADAWGGKYLCVYYTADQDITPRECREFLALRLPDWMIPLHFIALPRIPLTVNGKIDKRLLPEPELTGTGQYAAPRNEVEARMVELWQDVLGIPRVGVEDNFFALGGHSLTVTLLIAKIQQIFAVNLPFKEIFAKPTIRALSSSIAAIGKCASQEIKAVPKQDYYPLSTKQKRMYVLEQMAGIGTAYQITSAFVLEGDLDKERLSQAIDGLIARHDALRTSIALIDGQPMQQVHDRIQVKRTLIQAAPEEVEALIAQSSRRFDLSRPPLFRLELLDIGKKQHVLIFTIHHIIFDGFSMDVFLRELLALYQGKKLPDLKLQYGDYALWEEERLQSAAMLVQEEYWLTAYAGELPVINLPTDYGRPAVRNYEGALVQYTVDPVVTSALKTLAQQHQATMFMVCLAAFTVLLHKYTGQDDIIVGTPSSGRIHADLDNLIGMFVSTLPCRMYPAADKTFSQLLNEVRHTSLEALNNQEYPFEILLEKLNIRRDPSRNPLFDVMFSFTGGSAAPEKNHPSGLSLRPRETTDKAAQFDLTLDMAEEGDGMTLVFEYSTGLFRPETIRRMGTHLLTILRAVGESAHIPLKDVDMVTEPEKQQLLQHFNNTRRIYSSSHTVQDLFAKAVQQYPDKTALVYKNTAYTYSELDRRTNSLARLLRCKGLTKDDRAAILVGRSADSIIAILSVLKAGGCYVPIDAGYSADRISYMLADSGAKLLLSQQTLKDKASQFSGEWLDLGDEALYGGDSSRLDNTTTPEDLAYVIYTSGSTGWPKGVMIEHRSLVNLCQWHYEYHGLTAADNGAAYSGFGFDASVWETIPFITRGCTLHIIPDELRLDPLELNWYLEEHHVTVTNLPTQFCEQFMELTDNRSLRTLVTGGDKLNQWRQRSYKLVNEYGPTECTVSATVFDVDKSYSNIPIGKPLANTWLYVVDPHNGLQPVGVAGELCIAGTQVARGYLNRPELTAEKFVPNPFRTGEHNARMYRTGDLVRWLPDGNLEFLGRIDQQVKVRGYRIELGEIEQQLQQHPQIRAAVVLDADDEGGSKYLTAYIVPKESGLAPDQLKEYLLRNLPEYMIPSYFMELDDIPLTANGKIDRRALPRPAFRSSAADARRSYQAASNYKEEKIRKVWQDVLGLHDIGMEDNFFHLGGTSIKAITVAAKLQPYFDITINHIFEHQTIAALAAHCSPKQNHLKVKLAELKERFQQQPDSSRQARTEEILKEKLAAYQDANERYGHLDPKAVQHYRAVLLTGATGYLGVYLLRELFERTASQLYVPVRADSETAAWQRLQSKMTYYFGEPFAAQAAQSGRITVLTSQLQDDRLGLTEDMYEKLAGTVDCIIHSAANVRHYGHYDEFWQSNVKATLTLLELADQGRPKDFHHISTISVGEGSIPGCEAALFSEYETDMGQVLHNFYLKTKLEAELAVEAARARGMNANIYRVGNIVFHSGTGVHQENIDENAFYLQVKAFVNLGVVPTGLEVEFSFVNQLAQAIVKLATCRDLRQETYHLYNSHRVSLDEVLTDTALALQVTGLPYDAFIDHLYRHYDKPGFQQHIEQVMLHFGWMDDAEEEGSQAEDTELLVVADKTNSLLKQLGFEWRTLEPDAMKTMLEQALKERMAFLRQTPIFAALSPAEAALVARQSSLRLYGDETSILWEGDSNDTFYLIMDGLAEISRKSAAGWSGTLRVAGRNDFLGEETVLGSAAASVTVEAVMGDAVVLAIPAAVLSEMLASSPSLALGLLKALNNRIRRLETMVVNMG